MKQFALTSLNLARYAVALIEMVGGVVGLGILVWAIIGTGAFSFVWLLVAAFYALSFVAGLALWRKRPSGLALSLAIQAIQLPLVIAERMTFLVASGLGLWLKVGTTGIGVSRGETGGHFRGVRGPVRRAGVRGEMGASGEAVRGRIGRTWLGRLSWTVGRISRR